jgi:hypothetical protein
MFRSARVSDPADPATEGLQSSDRIRWRPQFAPVAPISLMVERVQQFLDQRGKLRAARGVVAGLAEFGDCLVRLAVLCQGDAEVGVCPGRVGLDPDRRTVFGDRLLQIPLVGQRETEVGVGLGKVVLDPDRRAEFGDRLIELPLVCQGAAQVVVGLGVLGIDPDRRTVFSDRVVQFPLGFQGDAEYAWLQ